MQSRDKHDPLHMAQQKLHTEFVPEHVFAIELETLLERTSQEHILCGYCEQV